jgi:hypothetical protein
MYVMYSYYIVPKLAVDVPTEGRGGGYRVGGQGCIYHIILT